MCQCQACAVGETLNRDLASLAVRSLLSLSFTFSPSTVHLETEINTTWEHQLSTDIPVHLKPCLPPQWHYFLPMSVLLRCISTSKHLHAFNTGMLSVSSASIWRWLKNVDLLPVLRTFLRVRVIDCESISCIVSCCWPVAKQAEIRRWL